MTIFYQHIGEKLWQRDAPKSIGTPKAGLKRFTYLDIAQKLSALQASEALEIKAKASELAPTGFQIWGIPEGARVILKDIGTGDFLMLLESTDFAYVGQVIHRISEPCWDLSQDIWGENRFPIIILLQGELITYPWEKFREEFKFDAGYHMRGNTMRLTNSRIEQSGFGSEEGFISNLMSTVGSNVLDLKTDFQAFANNLIVHMRLIKDRAHQAAFRKKVLANQGYQCAACNIAFPAVLDAAHIIPKESNGSDDPRNGIALCALHHRMFDTHMFKIDPRNYAFVASASTTVEDLRIVNSDISSIKSAVHKEAIKWRWDFQAAFGVTQK